MAEVVGVASSVISVVQITGKIISLCYDYQNGLRNGDRDIARILNEAKALRNVTEHVVELLTNSSGASTYSVSLQKLNERDGIIAQCLADLEDLETNLKKPVSDWKRLAQRLTWPLKEKDVTKTIESIHRMKGIIELALQADTSAAISEVRGLTKALDQNMNQLLRRGAETSDQQEFQVLLKWLDAPDQLPKYTQTLDKREKGTCEWLLSSAKYANWKSADHSSMWLHGIAGCGKTVLASAVIHDLQTSALKSNVRLNPEAGIAYYYFDFTDGMKANPGVALRSLVTQLSMSLNGAPHALRSYALQKSSIVGVAGDAKLTSPASISQPSTEGLLGVLKNMMDNFKDTYLILDALDEIKERKEMLGIAQQIISWKSKGLHILFTSRPEMDITVALKAQVDSVIIADPEQIDMDIDLMVRRQVQARQEQSQWPPSLQTEIEISLTSGAQGMFRWVECQLDRLDQCDNPRDIKTALASLPKSLSDTYDAILANLHDAHFDYAIKILMLLAVSSRPLTIDEAVELLAVDLEAEGGPVFDPDLRFLNPMKILSICSSLVTDTLVQRHNSIDEILDCRELRLSHYTVKEFLTSNIATLSGRSIRFSSILGVHEFAAEALLAYLLGLQQPCTEEMLTKLTLSRYAAESLWTHLSHLKYPYPANLKVLVKQFFQDNGQTEAFRNLYRLFDPDQPWAQQSLHRQDFPSSLYLASSKGFKDIVEELLNSGASPNEDEGFFGLPLHVAAYAGHSNIVKLLLDAQADPNKDGGQFVYALTAASAAGHLSIVNTLLEHGANPDLNRYPRMRFRRRAPPIFEAANHGYTGIVRALVEKGAHPNHILTQRRFTNALAAAAAQGYKDCVQLILPAANRDTIEAALRDSCGSMDHDTLELFFGLSPGGVLSCAARLGYQDLVTRYLDDNGHDETVLASSAFAGSALVGACKNGRLDIAQQLLSHGADINYQLRSYSAGRFSGSVDYAIICAVDKGDLELTRLLLHYAANVNVCGHQGPPLQIAIFRGHREIAESLVAHGAQLDDNRGSYGGPVQAAVLGKHPTLLDWAVRAGADVNMLSGEVAEYQKHSLLADYPIQAAAASSDINMLEYLLDHGADVNIYDLSLKWRYELSPRRRLPALSAATKSDDMTMVERLLNAGADVNQPTMEDTLCRPPLSYAVSNSNLKMVERLLADGADPNFGGVESDGIQSILATACNGNNAEIVSELLRAGADVNKHSTGGSRPGDGESPMHTAARYSVPTVLQILSQHGAKINEQIKDGWAPLHSACHAGNAETVDALVNDLHANTALALADGRLPLHSAASGNSPECMQVLIEHGADINLRDRRGRTPLHWAVKSVSPAATEWLLRRGADVTLKEKTNSMTAEDFAKIALKESDFESHGAAIRVLKLLRNSDLLSKGEASKDLLPPFVDYRIPSKWELRFPATYMPWNHEINIS